MGQAQVRTSWFAAARQRRLNDMQTILSRGDFLASEIIEFVNADEQTALHVAAHAGNVPIVNFLLDKGANIEAKDKYSYTAAHHAAEMGHMDVLRVLIIRGANINAKAIYDISALHCASRFNHVDTVRMLLANGAAVNAQTSAAKGQKTPLHYASRLEDWTIVRLLLKNGADSCLRDANGAPALAEEDAQRRGKLEVAQLVKQAPLRQRRVAFLLCLHSSLRKARKKLFSDSNGHNGLSISLSTTEEIVQSQPPIRRSFSNHPLFQRSLISQIFYFVDNLSHKEDWPAVAEVESVVRNRSVSETPKSISLDLRALDDEYLGESPVRVV